MSEQTPIIDEEDAALAEAAKVAAEDPEMPVLTPLMEERVTEVCRLMSLGASNGEVSRVCAVKWGVTTRQVKEYYLPVARARNRNLIGRPEDGRSDAVRFYSRMLQDTERRYNLAMSEIARAGAMIRDAHLSLENERDEGTWKAAKSALKEATTIKRRGQAEMDRAYPMMIQLRTKLDDVLGNNAPIKHALTTGDGKDVNKPAEPVDDSKAIGELFEQLSHRESVTEAMNGNGHKSNGSNGHAGNGNGKH